MKAAHTEQRNKRKEWVKQGRPRNRDNVYYKTYKDSKRSLRNIQKEAINKVEFKYYSDLKSSADCDIRLFWQLVNKRRKAKPSYISTIKRAIRFQTALRKSRSHSQTIFQIPLSRMNQNIMMTTLKRTSKVKLNRLITKKQITATISAVQ